MLLIIPHNTFYALYGMSNNFLIFTLKDFRAPYVCSHLYLYFKRPVNPPGRQWAQVSNFFSDIAWYNSKHIPWRFQNTNIKLNWWLSSLLATLGRSNSMTLFHTHLLTKFWRLITILQLQLPTHMVCIDILGQSIKVINTYFKHLIL